MIKISVTVCRKEKIIWKNYKAPVIICLFMKKNIIINMKQIIVTAIRNREQRTAYEEYVLAALGTIHFAFELNYSTH